MMKEHLLRIRPEIQEQNIAVIGAPRLDYFTQTDRIPTKETIYQKLGFSDTSRPFIHLATTELYPTEYLAKTIARAVATQDIPGNPYLYASIHPGGDVSKYDSFTRYGFIVRRSPGRHEEIPVPSFKYAPTEEDTFFLAGIFMHAGALVNHSSTTALESLVANVPVINVQYGMPFDWWRWHRSMVFRDFQQHYRDLISDGATYVATSKKTLIASLRDVLLHPDAKREARKKTVKRMITTTDGTASKKVLEYILAL